MFVGNTLSLEVLRAAGERMCCKKRRPEHNLAFQDGQCPRKTWSECVFGPDAPLFRHRFCLVTPVGLGAGRTDKQTHIPFSPSPLSFSFTHTLGKPQECCVVLLRREPSLVHGFSMERSKSAEPKSRLWGGYDRQEGVEKTLIVKTTPNGMFVVSEREFERKRWTRSRLMSLLLTSIIVEGDGDGYTCDFSLQANSGPGQLQSNPGLNGTGIPTVRVPVPPARPRTGKGTNQISKKNNNSKDVNKGTNRMTTIL